MPVKDPEKRRAYNRLSYQKHRTKRAQAIHDYYVANKDQVLTKRRNDRAKDPRQCLLNSARARAKKLGVLCTITKDDIRVPAKCPVFGIPLAVKSGSLGAGHNSPTIDRLDPKKGYIPSNIAVISMLANRMKGNATSAELRRIADWVDDRCP